MAHFFVNSSVIFIELVIKTAGKKPHSAKPGRFLFFLRLNENDQEADLYHIKKAELFHSQPSNLFNEFY